jgi:hypothetical protein
MNPLIDGLKKIQNESLCANVFNNFTISLRKISTTYY